MQLIIPDVGFAFVVITAQVEKSRCRKKKKSVISLVHRIKGKKEGKAVCEYKHTSMNLVVQLNTQNP